jgi:putative MATE family efflux protein
MRDLTQGSILRNLILFSLPMLFQSLFQNANQFISMILLGQLGKEVLAALTVAFPVIFLLIALIIGFGIGSTILIAQYRGARDTQNQNHAAQNSLVITGLLCIVLSILGYLFTDSLLAVMETPSDVWSHASIFLKWSFLGLIFMFMFNAVGSIFRGLGDSKTPMISVIGVSLLNVGLVPLFVFVLDLGIAGAAIASIVAYAVGTVLLWIYLHMRPYIADIRFIGFRFNWEIIKKILYLGLPMGIQQVLLALGGLVILRLVNSFGTNTAAAFGVGQRVDMIVFMPIMAIGMGVTTMVGQNIGARQVDRVKKTLVWGNILAWGISGILIFVIYILLYDIIHLFLPAAQDYHDVAPLAVEYILVMFITYPILGSIFVLSSGIRGAGSSIPPLIIVLIAQVIVRLPVAYFFAQPYYLGVSAIWWSQVISVSVGFILALLYTLYGPWLQKRLINVSNVPPLKPDPANITIVE